MCGDKDKQTLSLYDIKGEENTLSTFEQKENHGVVMFISMNVVNNYVLRPYNACVQHSKRPLVR